jgi:DnaJ-domain-containing protein 1
MRNGQWQEVACYGYPNRAENLRQCFLLLDRLRIAEQHGVQYQGLTYTKELVAAAPEAARRENILDAYDVLGAGPDDPIDLIKDIYRRKSMFYHPDKGGDQEKFKRLTKAYELIMKSRGAPI